MKRLAYIALGLMVVPGFIGNLATSPVVSDYLNWPMPGQQPYDSGLEAALGSGAGRSPLRSRSAGRWLASASFAGTTSIARLSAPQFEIAGNSIKAAVKLDSSAQDQYSASELFSRLMAHRDWQQARLDRFSVVRTYKVEDDKGKALAEEVVVMEYKKPGTETFTTTSADGSAFIRGHVFKQLMKREAGRARGRHDQDSSITPDNYTFETLGQEQVGTVHCTVVHAIPNRKQPYLFEGKIWIDDQDFAIVKAAGHLAKSPSFWINRVDFVRQYQKIDGFWFPIEEQATAKVRIYGTKMLTIDYADYTVNGVAAVGVGLERNRRYTAAFGHR